MLLLINSNGPNACSGSQGNVGTNSWYVQELYHPIVYIHFYISQALPYLTYLFNSKQFDNDDNDDGTSACQDSKTNIGDNSWYVHAIPIFITISLSALLFLQLLFKSVRYKCSQGNYSCFKAEGKNETIGSIGSGSW